jgi:hypothetical protein
MSGGHRGALAPGALAPGCAGTGVRWHRGVLALGCASWQVPRVFGVTIALDVVVRRRWGASALWYTG